MLLINWVGKSGLCVQPEAALELQLCYGKHMCVYVPIDECAYVFVLLGACLWEEEREISFSHIYLCNSGERFCSCIWQMY